MFLHLSRFRVLSSVCSSLIGAALYRVFYVQLVHRSAPTPPLGAHAAPVSSLFDLVIAWGESEHVCTALERYAAEWIGQSVSSLLI